MDTRGAISAFVDGGTWVTFLPSSDKMLELVIQWHGDSSLAGTAIDADRLREGRRLHHAGFSCLVAVVEPHT